MNEFILANPLSRKHLIRAAIHLQELYSSSRDCTALQRLCARFLVNQARDITADLSPLVDSLQSRSQKMGQLAKLSHSNRSQASSQMLSPHSDESTADSDPILQSILETMEETTAFSGVFHNLTERIDCLNEWGAALLWVLSVDTDQWDVLHAAQTNAVSTLISLVGQEELLNWDKSFTGVDAALELESSSLYHELLSNMFADDEDSVDGGTRSDYGSD
jgi:hypothetical protein